MNKGFYILLVFATMLQVNVTNAQGGTWTWMRGDITVPSAISLGNYGVKGVSNPNNDPPGRYHGNYWMDKQGNFWMTGGAMLASNYLNDLWKYTPQNNEWTWENGAQLSTVPGGVLGTQGIPSSLNFPPSSGLSGYTWTDTNNNLWYYHTWGDMWRYSIATNEWTWMNGQGISGQPSVYGTMGVASPLNNPGFHTEGKCAWKDRNDHLWLYKRGNMWMYDIATNQWTWMKGPGIAAPVAVFGTFGVPDINNQPALNQNWNCWQDIDYNFYMGYSMPASSAVWRFNPDTNEWAWVSGIDVLTGGSLGAKFVSQCVPSADRNPGKRGESRGGQYIDPETCTNYLWLSAGQNGTPKFNDLWLYKPDQQNTWTWISGDSTYNSSGNYGVQGVPSPNNILPSRTGHIMWVDSMQQVWIFGGVTLNASDTRPNDLWRFTPDSACVGLFPKVPPIVLNPPIDTFLCIGDATSMTLDTSYHVSISPMSHVTVNADTSVITFDPVSSTIYTVTASIQSAYCLKTKSIVFAVYVNDFPTQTFKDTMICEGRTYAIPLDSSFHFTFTPAALQYNPGDSYAVFNPSVTTTYTVTASKYGCPSSNPVSFTITVLPSPLAEFSISPAILEKGSGAFSLVNQSQNANHYFWKVNNTLIDTSVNTTWSPTDTGKICFTLIASNQLGCADTAIHCGTVLPGKEDMTSVIFIPNVFSPNGDGVNDVFNVIAKNITFISMSIYNRWGEQVFVSNELSIGWNGKQKGENVDSGVYFYLIEFKNRAGEKEIRKGDVTLLR